MTYEELEETLYNSQEWHNLKGIVSQYLCTISILILGRLLDTSKLEKLFSRINLDEDYSTTLLNPKLDKDR